MLLGGRSAARSRPVSYTHLDVYKRQLLATALRGRKTTVGRLRAEAEGRQRLRNRRLVRDLLTEASTGSRARWSVASSTTSCAATAFPSVLDSGWWRRWATRATSVGSTGRSRHTALSSSLSLIHI